MKKTLPFITIIAVLVLIFIYFQRDTKTEHVHQEDSYSEQDKEGLNKIIETYKDDPSAQ